MRERIVAILAAILCLGVCGRVHALPSIASTVVVDAGSLGDGVYQLQVGVRYQIRVHVQAGNPSSTEKTGVEPDTNNRTPASANLHNGFNTSVVIDSDRDFYYTIAPLAIGIYKVGFRLRTDRGAVFGRAPPIEIHAVTSQPGLFGWVRSKTSNAAIPGATVKLGTATTTTDSQGHYQLALPSGQPPFVTVTKTGYSEAIAIHVPSPGGIRVDFALEDAFPALDGSGISYLSYLDYSQGRTLLHVVRIDTALAEVHVNARLPLVYAENMPGLAVINGGFFVLPESKNPREHRAITAQGFLFAEGFAWPTVAITRSAVPAPMLTIKGSTVDIVDTKANTTNLSGDFDGAIQNGPWLVEGDVIQPNPGGDHAKYWARTSIGVAGTLVYFVVADGEGNHGSAGADQSLLAAFYHDVLHASNAMELDGGQSTQLAIAAGTNGQRRTVTLPTVEDNEAPPSVGGQPVLSFVSAQRKCVPRSCGELGACGRTTDNCGQSIVCPSECGRGSLCISGHCRKCPTPNCQNE